MPRRLRASKAKIRITLQDALSLRGRTRAELMRRYGSEEMALAYWHAHRTDMLQRGFGEPELPRHWTCPRADCERHSGDAA
jgi:hypothetical protein